VGGETAPWTVQSSEQPPLRRRVHAPGRGRLVLPDVHGKRGWVVLDDRWLEITLSRVKPGKVHSCYHDLKKTAPGKTAKRLLFRAARLEPRDLDGAEGNSEAELTTPTGVAVPRDIARVGQLYAAHLNACADEVFRILAAKCHSDAFERYWWKELAAGQKIQTDVRQTNEHA
jgi:hypothetical protein